MLETGPRTGVRLWTQLGGQSGVGPQEDSPRSLAVRRVIIEAQGPNQWVREECPASLGDLLGCLRRRLQQVFWAADVRAGLFLARAPLSTSWPTVGDSRGAFLSGESSRGCQGCVEEHGAGQPLPGTQRQPHSGIDQSVSRHLGDQASLILPARCSGPGLNWHTVRFCSSLCDVLRKGLVSVDRGGPRPLLPSTALVSLR